MGRRSVRDSAERDVEAMPDGLHALPPSDFVPLREELAAARTPRRAREERERAVREQRGTEERGRTAADAPPVPNGGRRRPRGPCGGRRSAWDDRRPVPGSAVRPDRFAGRRRVRVAWWTPCPGMFMCPAAGHYEEEPHVTERDGEVRGATHPPPAEQGGTT
ncbi:hypothetical protein ACPF8X_15330 [Streptomyces sp. G35A]